MWVMHLTQMLALLCRARAKTWKATSCFSTVAKMRGSLPVPLFLSLAFQLAALCFLETAAIHRPLFLAKSLKCTVVSGEYGPGTEPVYLEGDKSALRPSGLRLGTPALTSRGLLEKEFQKVAQFIHRGEDKGLEVSHSDLRLGFLIGTEQLRPSR